MGKRELVLIALFLVAGVVVYHVTAPPAPPGSDLSIGGIVHRMRRSVQGARESATAASKQTVPVDGSVRTLRIAIPRPSDLTVTGADRDDIAIDIRATARGYTIEEAKAAAQAATVNAQTTNDTLTLTGAWLDLRGPAGFVTQATITIVVPKRLAVRLQPHIGALSVSNVASLEIVSSRGETHVLDTWGPVQLVHIGGVLEVRGGTALKLSARNSRGDVTAIAGTTSIEAIGSRLKLSGLTGTLDIESRNSDVSVEKIAGLKPPLRYNGTSGELRIEGLRTDARIDGRNTDVTVTLGAPAPVTIYNVGSIVMTAPPEGYNLDAAATEGHITIDDPGITPTEGPESHAQGAVRGGGPLITLRATRGRIEIHKPEGR
jgi:hypothetical protein